MVLCLGHVLDYRVAPSAPLPLKDSYLFVCLCLGMCVVGMLVSLKKKKTTGLL